MRILLVQHGPAHESPAGTTNAQLAAALVSSGHEVRLLAMDEGMATRAFARLTDLQLADYRAMLRSMLDKIIHQFNPHLVHVQHLWVLAHLALESGVPYVAQVWGPELTFADLDPRYQPLVEQAAENAGRLLVADQTMATQLLVRFEIGSERVVVTSPTEATSIAKLYKAMLVERYGQVPP